MKHVFLGLGANVGAPKRTLLEAKKELEDLPGISSLRFSKFYRTSPLSDIPQPDYTNCVCAFQSALSLSDLWQKLQQIEVRLGKKKKPKNAPRPIDIDILAYGEEKICTEELQIPHPRWAERLFVLVPLLDLCDFFCGVDLRAHIAEMAPCNQGYVYDA